MLNLNPWRTSSVTKVRLLQLVFLVALLWFFFWAHIYEMVFWNKSFVESLTSSVPNVLIYLASLIIIITLEVYSKRLNKISNSSNLSLTENFYEKKEQLNEMKSKKTQSIIELPLLATGAMLLVASIIFASTIIALIGLSLTFWGILFLLTRSNKFVSSDVFEATNTSPYSTLDRIINDLNYDGNAIYIPTPSEEGTLPEHMSVLKELLVFISSKTSMAVPSLDKLVEKQFMITNPEGVCITPPGSGLVNLFETELKTSLTKIPVDELCDLLPVIIVSNLELASNFDINVLDGTVHIKINDSAYNNLYSKKEHLKSVSIVGCPLVSAFGCALAMATHEFVTLTQTKFSPDLRKIEAWFKVGAR